MNTWLTTQIGADAANIVSYVTLSILAIITLWIFVLLINRLSKSAYASKDKNSQIRLSVCDAAAIDNKRRLVLIKRDDIEHLILIGGPTDLVIETNISNKEKNLDNSLQNFDSQDVQIYNQDVQIYNQDVQIYNNENPNFSRVNEIKTNISTALDQESITPYKDENIAYKNNKSGISNENYNDHSDKNYKNDQSSYHSTLINDVSFNAEINDDSFNTEIESESEYNSQIASSLMNKQNKFADHEKSFGSKNNLMKSHGEDFQNKHNSTYNNHIASKDKEEDDFDDSIIMSSLKTNSSPVSSLTDHQNLSPNDPIIAPSPYKHEKKTKFEVENSSYLSAINETSYNSRNTIDNTIDNSNQTANVSQKPLENITDLNNSTFENNFQIAQKQTVYENRVTSAPTTTTKLENDVLKTSNSPFGQSKPINPYQMMKKAESLSDNHIGFNTVTTHSSLAKNDAANVVTSFTKSEKQSISQDEITAKNNLIDNSYIENRDIVGSKKITPLNITSLNKVGIISTATVPYTSSLIENTQNSNKLDINDTIINTTSQNSMTGNDAFNTAAQQNINHSSVNDNHQTKNVVQANKPQLNAERATTSHESMAAQNNTTQSILRPPLMAAIHNFTPSTDNNSLDNNASYVKNDFANKLEDIAPHFENVDDTDIVDSSIIDNSIDDIHHSEQYVQAIASPSSVKFIGSDTERFDNSKFEQNTLEKYQEEITALEQNINNRVQSVDEMSQDKPKKLQKFSLQLLDPEHILDTPIRNETNNHQVKNNQSLSANNLNDEELIKQLEKELNY